MIPALSSTRLNLGYMHINQTPQTGHLISSSVLDYLRHKFIAGLSHPVYKGLSADWRFRWQKREGSYTKYGNNGFNEEIYPAFALVDIKLNWEIASFKTYLSINNLFNQPYYDIGNLPQPGFWLTGGVIWELK
jgi:iron complex outermembrane receptor protein